MKAEPAWYKRSTFMFNYKLVHFHLSVPTACDCHHSETLTSLLFIKFVSACFRYDLGCFQSVHGFVFRWFKGSDINYGREGAKKLGEIYPRNFVIPPMERTQNFAIPPILAHQNFAIPPYKVHVYSIQHSCILYDCSTFTIPKIDL